MHGSRRGARDIEHLGSAHDEEELESLKAAARQRLVGGQGELDLGLDAAERSGSSGPLEIVSSRMEHLWDGLCAAYDALGLEGPLAGTRCSGTWPRAVGPNPACAAQAAASFRRNSPRRRSVAGA